MTTCDIPKAFHIMAKPTGSACNLHCGYCFFLKKERLYPGSDFRMSAQVHKAYIRQLLEFHRTPQVTVAWQGGEPTLMGLDFFRRSVEFQKKPGNPAPTSKTPSRPTASCLTRSGAGSSARTTSS